ncbi:MAG: hypothetical protein M0Z85_00105 [Gammaproteobacteria bacterium]|nr:hypothetical protein [Gammaproteobacteria bacterium]
MPGQFYFATVGSNGQWWSAGDGGTAVTLKYASWSNTQIVVDGFSGAYGQNGWVVVPGNAFIVAGNALPNQYTGKLPSSDSPGPSSGEVIGNTYNSSSQVTSSSQVPSTAVSQSSYIDNPQAGDTYTFTSNGKTYEVTATAAQAAVQAEQDAAWLEQHPGATAAQLAAANP